MADEVLVRLWRDGFQTGAGHLVTAFDHGFTVTDEDHKVYDAIMGACLAHDISRLNITVLSTPELHWKIHTVHHDKAKCVMKVQCEPWIEGLRKTIVSDEWYIANVKG